MTSTILIAFRDIWARLSTEELRRRVDENVAYLASGHCATEACATEAGFLLAEILRREVEG